MYRIALFIVLMLVFTIGAGACSVVTEFEDDDGDSDPVNPDGGTTEYVLSANVGTPVTVQLGSNNLATITLALTAPFPTHVDDTEARALLTDGVISLSVQNVTSGTTVSLAQGTLVAAGSMPTKAGEFAVQFVADGTRNNLSVTFFNEVGGKRLRANGSYLSSITVLTNTQHIKAETFTRPVSVL